MCIVVEELDFCYIVFRSRYVDYIFFFFFSSRRRHTRLQGDWSSDVCSSDLKRTALAPAIEEVGIRETPPVAKLLGLKVHSHQAVGLWVRQGLQKNAADHGKDRKSVV